MPPEGVRPNWSSNAASRALWPISVAVMSVCQALSSSARAIRWRAGPLSAQGPIVSRKRAAMISSVNTAPARSPARPKNLPRERIITRPGCAEPVYRVRLSSPRPSAKASSNTSQPPRMASRRYQPISWSGLRARPVGLLG